MNYIPLITGIWLIVMALEMHTANFRSAAVFQIIPFFLGIGCMYTSAKLLLWI